MRNALAVLCSTVIATGLAAAVDPRNGAITLTWAAPAAMVRAYLVVVNESNGNQRPVSDVAGSQTRAVVQGLDPLAPAQAAGKPKISTRFLLSVLIAEASGVACEAFRRSGADGAELAKALRERDVAPEP